MLWSRLYRRFALSYAIAQRGGYLSNAAKLEFRILFDLHEDALRIALRERATEFLRPPREIHVAITKTAEPQQQMLEDTPNACVTKFSKSGYLIAINGM